ncbi:MAG: hypothetical protein DCC71_12130 [Proteobacteria bacterium]|nr:MAG: hypothetical protein DCC71_12130 [Pseudomonadota bacterium]
MFETIYAKVNLAKEALRAIERGVPEDGLVGEEELRERAKRRLTEALAALESDHVRPLGAA